MEDIQKNKSWRQFINLIKATNPPKRRLTIAISMSVLTTLVGLIIPLFTKNLVNNFSMTSINLEIIVFLILAFIAQAIAGGISTYLLNYVGQYIIAKLRKRLWKKYLALPVSYYDHHKTGEMMSRMTNDTDVVKGLIVDHSMNFFTGCISTIGSIMILLFLDWKMTLTMLIAAPLALFILMRLGGRMNQISRGLQDETASFTAIINQVLSEIRLVKASNAENMEYKRGTKGITNLFQFGLREGKVQAMISPLISFILMALLIIVIGYGGMRVTSGALSVGDLVAFMLYLFQIMVPMIQFSTFFTQLQKAKGATERIITALAHYEDDYDSGKQFTNVFQPMRIENLTFAYESGEHVLKDVNFTVTPRKVTGIVGPSGGGKTTFFSLLQRFYQPLIGSIKLGQEPIDQFSLRSWRRQIGYVTQDSELMDGTIRENITYGLEQDIDERDVRRVAQMAYADQFIEQLPEKYETEVGERGIKLSGGQRQRIGIARALLRDPNILMLDEATSNLDSQSEQYVQKALENLMNGRTTLVIAHRLSTVVDADQIIFIEKGEVTGIGTHEELFQSHEKYRTFANQQLRIKES